MPSSWNETDRDKLHRQLMAAIDRVTAEGATPHDVMLALSQAILTMDATAPRENRPKAYEALVEAATGMLNEG